MARIRTIKPEFWASEQVANCDMLSRLLFIGLWNFCDDQGIHTASLKRLKMEVFPGDEFADGLATIRRLIDDLIANGLLIEYEVEGEWYWQVTGWKHQKIEKPNNKYPLPQVQNKRNSTTNRRPVAERSTTDRQPFDHVRERNGKEGKGKERSIVRENSKIDVNLPPVLAPNGSLLKSLNAPHVGPDEEANRQRELIRSQAAAARSLS